MQKPPPEKFPRSNGKIKMENRKKPVLTGKNGKMKWETTKNRKKPVLTGKIGKMGNGKNGKV